MIKRPCYEERDEYILDYKVYDTNKNEITNVFDEQNTNFKFRKSFT